MIKIKKLKIIKNYELQLTFDNNKIKIFDVKPYLENGIFQELKNQAYFRLVKNKGYFIEWPNEHDLSSDTLYYEGKIYTPSMAQAG